jgi:hypothetical protein
MYLSRVFGGSTERQTQVYNLTDEYAASLVLPRKFWYNLFTSNKISQDGSNCTTKLCVMSSIVNNQTRPEKSRL